MTGARRATGIEVFDRAERTLRAACLACPEAYEDHPWGDTVYKVKGKIFVFMGEWKGTFGISAKLPVSAAVALMLPFAEPTGYGLGKAGWVSARFPPTDDIPIDMLLAWIEESYRAVAPKKLAASLPARDGAPPPADALRASPSTKAAVSKTKAKPAVKATTAKAAAKAKPAAEAKPAR
jgi:predicted DNA-binding protein (MmcQ/YjbR family)